MNNSRTKRLPKIFLSQFIVSLIMVVMALSLIFYAQGYRINLNNLKISKTGIASFVSYPRGADVYIDGKLMEEKTPFAINLTPGTYSAEIVKDGYHSWERSYRVDSGLVTEYKNIILFRENPTIKELTEQSKINLLKKPIDVLAQKNQNDPVASNTGYEIWVNEDLITRFSTPVSSVNWYSDHMHILFQQSDEIRVVDIDGTNNTLLIKLKNNLPTNFITNSKGTELYYSDNGEYKVAEIR